MSARPLANAVLTRDILVAEGAWGLVEREARRGETGGLRLTAGTPVILHTGVLSYFARLTGRADVTLRSGNVVHVRPESVRPLAVRRLMDGPPERAS